MIELAAVIVGALLTLGFQNLYSLKRENVAIINNYIDLYKELEDAAVKYWLIDIGKKENSSIGDECISRINGTMAASGYLYEVSDKILGKYNSEFIEADQYLFELVTGDAFMAKARVKDVNRAPSIITVSHKLRLILLKSRKAQFWAI